MTEWFCPADQADESQFPVELPAGHWAHGSRLGREHCNLAAHLAEDHGTDPALLLDAPGPAVHGHDPREEPPRTDDLTAADFEQPWQPAPDVYSEQSRAVLDDARRQGTPVNSRRQTEYAFETLRPWLIPLLAPSPTRCPPCSMPSRPLAR
jgi:hypothetical protein